MTRVLETVVDVEPPGLPARITDERTSAAERLSVPWVQLVTRTTPNGVRRKRETTDFMPDGEVWTTAAAPPVQTVCRSSTYVVFHGRRRRIASNFGDKHVFDGWTVYRGPISFAGTRCESRVHLRREPTWRERNHERERRCPSLCGYCVGPCAHAHRDGVLFGNCLQSQQQGGSAYGASARHLPQGRQPAGSRHERLRDSQLAANSPGNGDGQQHDAHEDSVEPALSSHAAPLSCGSHRRDASAGGAGDQTECRLAGNPLQFSSGRYTGLRST